MFRLAPPAVLFAAVLPAVAVVPACSSDGPSAPSSGELRLSLTGRGTSGATYRLRDARLTIEPAGVVLDTEVDPDRQLLSAVLDAGLYTLDLADGWRLERVTNGVAEPVFAVLTSADPQVFDVFPGQVTPLVLTFRADGQDVVTGPGQVDVDIDVDDTAGIDGGWPDGGTDAGVPDARVIDAMPAPHYQYVVSRIELPLSNSTQLKLDIDGNGTRENKFGAILAALNSQAGGAIDLQATVDQGVARGDTILLADLETSSFIDGPARVRSYEGIQPVPAPCADPFDTVCGLHLQGTGSFQVSPAVTPGLVDGQFVGGQFVGGPGTLTVRLRFGAGLLDVPLRSARVVLDGVSPSGIASGLLGGGIAKTDVDSVVVPSFHQLISDVVALDCSLAQPAPDCGCAAGSTGRTLLGIFDVDDSCSIDLLEVTDSPFIRTLFGPDLDLQPPANQTDSLSFVVGITAVPASFPQ
jgi:hypothetical protein